MIRIVNESFNPYFNLALEEYLLKEFSLDNDLFVFWQNSPAVIVGRNQDTASEIDQEFVSKNGVAVVRRLTGGGAVYHDLGNLNFTFIARGQKCGYYNFASFALPVVEALGSLSVRAEFSGRNDITVQGRKVSGNAQYRYQDSVLHHGTLLFDSNMENLVRALRVNPDKLISKGVASVRSRVANIREYLPVDLEMSEFKATLVQRVSQLCGDAGEYHLAGVDLRRVEELVDTKYATWEWNYGASPGYAWRRSGRFDWGKIEILLDVREDLIAGCKIYGDFFGSREISGLERRLINLPLVEQTIRQALEQVDLAAYICGLDSEALIKLLLQGREDAQPCN